MTELEALIHWWETTKDTQEWLWSPNILKRVEQTIAALQELKKLKGE